jgi:hypothetical protein
LLAILPPAASLAREAAWPGLAKQGAWFSLDRPFGEMLPALAAAIAARTCPPAFEEIERTWLFECGTEFSALAGATVLSWDALDTLRREFLRRFNAVQRDLRSVDATSEDLRRADIGRLAGPAIAANPRVREFLRSVLLSGNGSLVFGNSFVEWGASEALRRAQPQALIASFGMRRKLKPFSSLVLFEDQNRSNPVPDSDDPAGSLVDAVLLAEYVSPRRRARGLLSRPHRHPAHRRRLEPRADPRPARSRARHARDARSTYRVRPSLARRVVFVARASRPAVSRLISTLLLGRQNAPPSHQTGTAVS